MLTLRAATPKDAESMVELTAAGWRAAYRGIVPDERIQNLPIAAWRHDISSGLRSPRGDSFTRIAEVAGGTAGYCYVAAPGRGEDAGSKVAEVVAVYVDPDRWRRGIGTALLESAREGAVEAGYGELVLWSFEANAPALALYEARGWTREDERRPHQASGAPTVRHRLALE